MILRRLRPRRFLGLPDQWYEFAPGLTVIVGPNEAGKSSLRSAIRAALYGNPATTSSKFRDEFRSWGTEEPPVLVLEFEVDAKTFVLTKDFAARKITLTDDLGQTWDQHKAVQERILAQLGLVSEDLFEATAQVAQAELERIHLTSIAKELGRIVGGGGEDAATAIRRLEQHVRAMEKGTKVLTKDPGLLKTLSEKATALREEQVRLSASAAAADRLRPELATLQTTLATTAETLEVKQALLRRNAEIVALQERLEGKQREEAMLEEKRAKLEETLTALAQVDGELESATAAGLPSEEATSAARKLHERAAILEMQAGRLRHELTQPDDETPVRSGLWRGIVAVGAGLALVGILAAVAGIRTLGVPTVILGAGAAGVGWWRLWRSTSTRALAEIRRQERERRLADDERALEETRSELASKLSSLGTATVKEAEQKLQQHRDLSRSRGHLQQFLTGLRSGRSDEDIAEQWKTVRRDVFGLQERLQSPEISAHRITPLELTALEREVQQLGQQLSTLRDRERRLLVGLERHTIDADALAAIEEQGHGASEALARAQHRHAVYAAALAALREAHQQAQVPLREIMQKKASEYLAILSNGRYRRLQVDPDNQERIELGVWSEEAGGWVETREPHLSRGTVDVVYLAARLALVDVLAGGKRPPLLFDDPFITFDEQRRQAAAVLLRELARTHQIFLFTYTRHFDEVADLLIELPSRKEVTAASVRTASSPPAPEPVPAPPTPVGPLWDQTH
ncbi:MAG TPA: AAA family ATPase [bacterium]